MEFLHRTTLPAPPYYSQLKRGQPEPQTTSFFDKSTAPELPRINSTDLVLQAFTHTSLRTLLAGRTPHQYPDNERLSKLGKVVLDSVVIQLLFNLRPLLRAAAMAERKGHLLSDDMFEAWVNHYELLKKVRCAPAVRHTLTKPQETREIFYAYVGGVYVDSGSEVVRQWIEQLLGRNLNPGRPSDHGISSPGPMIVDDRSPPPFESMTPPPLKRVKAEGISPGPPAPHTIFFGAQPAEPPAVRQPAPQAFPLPPPSLSRPNPLAPARPSLPFLPLFNQMAAQRRVTVTYEPQFSGPSHAGLWVVRCIVNGIPKGEGSGSSKQNAKEEAARQAYYAMGWT